MASCERCWHRAGALGMDYGVMLRQAEAEGAACTKDTEEGARLRAGEYWDEFTKRDTRFAAQQEPPHDP